MNVGKRIQQRREALGLTVDQMAEALGKDRSTVYRYERGDIEKLPTAILEPLSKILQTTPACLMGWNDDNDIDFSKYGIRPIQLKKFPMLGKVACGEPIYANEEYETYIEASSDINADFCLTAKGDSMINARIFDGDVVFVKSQPDVENGEIAVVIINDEATLKRVYKFADSIELRPENPAHTPMIYRNEQLQEIRILGKAVAFQSYIR